MLEDGLSLLLTADATLTGLIADRLYPVILPESPTYPAVTLQLISSVPQYTLSGALGLTKARVELNAWCDSLSVPNGYATCKQVAQAIRNVLEDYKGTLNDGTVVSGVQVVNSTDYYDSDARIYRVQTDFSLWASC